MKQRDAVGNSGELTLELVEECELALDDTVDELLPELVAQRTRRAVARATSLNRSTPAVAAGRS